MLPNSTSGDSSRKPDSGDSSSSLPDHPTQSTSQLSASSDHHLLTLIKPSASSSAIPQASPSSSNLSSVNTQGGFSGPNQESKFVLNHPHVGNIDPDPEPWIPHPLSPHELQWFRTATAQHIRTIQSLEASLSAIAPDKKNQLKKELTIARKIYQNCFCQIFRINDLPNEILTNIFRYVAWSAPSQVSGIGWRLWLTWTCRHWRTVTLEDPTLWSAIWFRDPPPFNRSIAWFDRAGSAPLDLRISDHGNHTFTDTEMEALLERLLTRISSIRMLIVTVSHWEPVLVVLDKFRTAGKDGALINIERFELHRTGSPYVQIGAGYEPVSFREPMALFGGAYAPSLKYFSINGVHVDWRKSILTNLTTIDLRRIPLELSPDVLRFREMLSNSPALRKLCLDGAGPQYQFDEARGLPPVQLNHLKILVIADFSVNYANYILAHIAAPHVRDLTLLNCEGEDYTSLFATMTSRFPEVRMLTVYSVEIVESAISGRTVIRWLQSMPLLNYLRIANIKSRLLELFLYDPQTFQRLRQLQPPGRSTICPQLSILECQAVDPSMIAAWGTERRKVGAPLSKIYFTTQEWAAKLTREQHAALNMVAPLFILNRAKSTEEEALMA